jgi:hypothetical protein
MWDYSNYIEELDELLNERRVYTTDEEREEIRASNEAFLNDYHYRCNPQISKRLGHRQ